MLFIINCVLLTFSAICFLTMVFYYFKTKIRFYGYFALTYFCTFDDLPNLVLVFTSERILDFLLGSVFQDAFRSAVNINGSASLIADNRTDLAEASQNYKLFIVLIYAGPILSALGSLVFSLSLLDVIAVWIGSIRKAGYLYHRKLKRVSFRVKLFKVLCIIFGLSRVVCIILSDFISIIVLVPLVAVDLIYVICNLWMLVDTIWMAIELKNPINSSIHMKRTQLIRIVFLVIFQGSTTHSYYPLYVFGIGSVFWIAECLLLMWPETLVDLEVPPLGSYSNENFLIEKV